MENPAKAGVFTTVSELVEPLMDNPAVRMIAQKIGKRVQGPWRN